MQHLSSELNLPQLADKSGVMKETIRGARPFFDPRLAQREADDVLGKFDITFPCSGIERGKLGVISFSWAHVNQLAGTWGYHSIAGDFLTARQVLDIISNPPRSR